MVTDAEITTLGEKGQVVIPQRLRAELGMEPRTKFLVFGEGDVIVLKRLSLPDAREEWSRIFAELGARKPGLTAKDVAREVAAVRRAKRRRPKDG